MKKVLIVAYHFPPSNAVGALRPAKFAEYLPEFGWEPIVLAGDEEVEGEPQFVPMGDSHANVTHVRKWPGLRRLWRDFKKTLRDEGQHADARAEAQWREQFERIRRDRSLAVRVRELAYGLMSLPDHYHGWILPTVYHGVGIIKRERPDAILATSPPHSAQVAGLLLARLSGLPLLTDFRDPWIGNPATPDYVTGGPTYRVERWLESRVLDRSARVVVATREHALELAARREDCREKISTVPNGFDASTFEGLRRGGSERFTITYVGNFYHSRSPQALFDAIARILSNGDVNSGDLEIRLVGDCDFADGRSVRQMASDAGLNGCLTLVGQLPHRQALAEVTRSDLLLLLATEQPRQVPTKAYEYIAAGRPILALTDEGATARLMADAGADVVSDPDPSTIATVVERHLRGWKPRQATPWTCPSPAIRFERRETTRALAGLLDGISGD